MILIVYAQFRAIDEMVEGAESGDHFFFHCKLSLDYYCVRASFGVQILGTLGKSQTGIIAKKMEKTRVRVLVQLNFVIVSDCVRIVIVTSDGKDLIDNVSTWNWFQLFYTE